MLKYPDGSEEVLYLAVESYMLEGEQPSSYTLRRMSAVSVSAQNSISCAGSGRFLADSAEPIRGKHGCEDEFDEDASSISTSKRQCLNRTHGQAKSNDTHSMHGAATTLVDLAQTYTKDKGDVAVQHAKKPELATVGRCVVSRERFAAV